MRPTYATLLFLASSAASAAGMYDQPWSIVERGYNSETRKESAIGITRIDGASPRNPRQSDPLSPGKHVINVRFETARGNFKPETRDLELDLAPCTRYRIVAAYQSRTGPDWEPKVYTEPIGECRRKFAKKGS